MDFFGERDPQRRKKKEGGEEERRRRRRKKKMRKKTKKKMKKKKDIATSHATQNKITQPLPFDDTIDHSRLLLFLYH